MDPTPGLSAAGARREAALILRQSRFRPSRLPRPLHGVFATLGRWLSPVGGPLARAGAAVARFLFGSPWGVITFSALVLLVAAGMTLGLRRRRLRPRPLEEAGAGVSPAELRHRARRAEESGRWDEAYRLYFGAVLLQAQQAGRLPTGPSLTVGQARRRLSGPDFARAADRFEAVAYGGSRAGAEDLVLVRSGWERA